jgi:VCBS repeat-containing protein
MKKTVKQANRIIENIFDIICNTQFKNEAEKQMIKDLKDKNITLNQNELTIESLDGSRVQYTISINGCNDMSTEFIKEHDLATKLKVSKGTLRNWRSQGVGPPYYKLRGSVVYKADDINTWLDTQKIIHKESN